MFCLFWCFSYTLFQSQYGTILGCCCNDCGQLFVDINPNEQHYYNPIITNIKNPSFCVLGAGTTAIFKNYIPPMSPNKGLNIDQFNFNQETDISMLKEKVSKSEKENEELKKQLKKKTKFFSI